jgi:hypothetical protein
VSAVGAVGRGVVWSVMGCSGLVVSAFAVSVLCGCDACASAKLDEVDISAVSMRPLWPGNDASDEAHAHAQPRQECHGSVSMVVC